MTDFYGQTTTEGFPVVDQVPCPIGDTACANAQQVANATAQGAASAMGAGMASGLSAASAVQASQQSIANQLGAMQAASAAGLSYGGSGSSGPVTVANQPTDYARSGEAATAAASIVSALAPGSTTVSTPSDQTIYTKGSRTISQSFSDFTTSMRNTPIVSAAGQFFTVNVSGACSTWSMHLTLLGQDVGTFVVNHFCNPPFTDYLPMIRGLVLVIFSIVAFRVAIL